MGQQKCRSSTGIIWWKIVSKRSERPPMRLATAERWASSSPRRHFQPASVLLDPVRKKCLGCGVPEWLHAGRLGQEFSDFGKGRSAKRIVFLEGIEGPPDQPGLAVQADWHRHAPWALHRTARGAAPPVQSYLRPDRSAAAGKSLSCRRGRSVRGASRRPATRSGSARPGAGVSSSARFANRSGCKGSQAFLLLGRRRCGRFVCHYYSSRLLQSKAGAPRP